MSHSFPILVFEATNARKRPPQAVNEEILERLQSFSVLPDGWHYGEGCAASSFTVECAIELCSLLTRHGLHEVEVFPGIYGGITVFGYRGKHALEIFCNPSGLFDLLYELEGKIECRENDMQWKELDDHVGDLSWRKGWSVKMWLSDFSTSYSSIKSCVASPAIPSPKHQVREAYRSFQSSVLRGAVVLNASTLLVFTSPIMTELQPSFGGSPPISFHQMLEWKKSPPRLETTATLTSTI